MMTEEQTRRFDEALKRLGGDQDTLAMLAAIAAEDAPPMLARLNEHAATGDGVNYAKVAHALKGLLSTFETHEPVSELQPIIDAARRQDNAEVMMLQETLAPALMTLILEISNVA